MQHTIKLQHMTGLALLRNSKLAVTIINNITQLLGENNETFRVSRRFRRFFSSAAHAQAVFSEFAVGVGFPSQVDTINYDVISTVNFVTPGGNTIAPGDRLVGTLSGNYNGGITAGLAIGIRGVGDKHVGLNISYDYLQANLDRVTAAGTLNGAPLTEIDSIETLKADGFEFNNEVNLVLGNIRYDFVGPRERLQPYVEIGAGGAFIENSKSTAAFAASAGFRVPLGLGFYMGARYRYVKALGYEDQLGIEYNDLNAHVISAVLGAQL